MFPFSSTGSVTQWLPRLANKADIERALNRVLSALALEGAGDIERRGGTITFSGGMFHVRGDSVWFQTTRGEITIYSAENALHAVYKLTHTEALILAIFPTTIIVVVMRSLELFAEYLYLDAFCAYSILTLANLGLSFVQVRHLLHPCLSGDRQS